MEEESPTPPEIVREIWEECRQFFQNVWRKNTQRSVEQKSPLRNILIGGTVAIVQVAIGIGVGVAGTDPEPAISWFTGAATYLIVVVFVSDHFGNLQGLARSIHTAIAVALILLSVRQGDEWVARKAANTAWGSMVYASAESRREALSKSRFSNPKPISTPAQRAFIYFGDFVSPYAPVFVPAAGWPLRMNINLTDKGIGPAEVSKAYGGVYLRNDVSEQTQREVVEKFKTNIWERFKPSSSETLIPGVHVFVTAQGENERLTEQDTAGFPGSLRFMFIVAEAQFFDHSGMHHARYCGWGRFSPSHTWIEQPAITLWNHCQIFNHDGLPSSRAIVSSVPTPAALSVCSPHKMIT